MKPLLIVPLTSEDEDIWHFVGLYPYWALRFELETLSISADRRDAELMSWLSNFAHRHYGRMPPMPKAAQLPMVHLWLRIDPDWPLGHYLIDLT